VINLTINNVVSGIPVLVNTSFNVHEESIVESPDDDIKTPRMGAIDYVYMPPYLFSLKNNC
jgi:carbamoyltransferase